MKFIDLNELENRIKALNKPTPQQVINLITVMREELNSRYYLHASSIGLGSIKGGLYDRA